MEIMQTCTSCGRREPQRNVFGFGPGASGSISISGTTTHCRYCGRLARIEDVTVKVRDGVLLSKEPYVRAVEALQSSGPEQIRQVRELAAEVASGRVSAADAQKRVSENFENWKPIFDEIARFAAVAGLLLMMIDLYLTIASGREDDVKHQEILDELRRDSAVAMETLKVEKEQAAALKALNAKMPVAAPKEGVAIPDPTSRHKAKSSNRRKHRRNW